MELRQLEYFRVIAETESIHEAARRLNMSQPPLSYQLKQLEAEPVSYTHLYSFLLFLVIISFPPECFLSCDIL